MIDFDDEAFGKRETRPPVRRVEPCIVAQNEWRIAASVGCRIGVNQVPAPRDVAHGFDHIARRPRLAWGNDDALKS